MSFKLIRQLQPELDAFLGGSLPFPGGNWVGGRPLWAGLTQGQCSSSRGGAWPTRFVKWVSSQGSEALVLDVGRPLPTAGVKFFSGSPGMTVPRCVTLEGTSLAALASPLPRLPCALKAADVMGDATGSLAVGVGSKAGREYSRLRSLEASASPLF